MIATRDGGQHVAPLVAAAALFRNGQLDLHFIQFKYRQSYKNSILNNDLDSFQAILKQSQLSVECLQPTFISSDTIFTNVRAIIPA